MLKMISRRTASSCFGLTPLKLRRGSAQSIPSRHFQSNSSVFRVSEEVREAINAKQPVVALESTIYTHGLPYPDNLRLSSRLENIIRQDGGVPATVGVLDGIARVGLAEGELARLVEKPGPRKISRRDFGLALRDNTIHGGTTIAGTMILAHLAGIRVFATGGLGGVHKGGERSLDISADLTELGRTPVAVICSGCKGFLDIGRTLEYLETQGVGVATFADGRDGQVDFPAFWSRDSGFSSPSVLKDETEAAEVIHTQTTLPVHSGLLFANPVPEASSIPREELDQIIRQAIDLADQARAYGSANTPFVLKAIKDLSNGRSVQANEALVEANVRRGSRVARELSKLELQHASSSTNSFQPSIPAEVRAKNATPSPEPELETKRRVDILVAGSIALDTSCTYKPLPTTADTKPTQPHLHTSNPASITQSLGGVGANVARAAQLLGAKTKLLSIVADDHAGKLALEGLKHRGMDTSDIHILPSTTTTKTAQYVAINDADAQLNLGMADMSILEHAHHMSFSQQWDHHITSIPTSPSNKPWLVTDANWRPDQLHAFLATARHANINTAYEPVSVPKSIRLLSSSHVPSETANAVPRIVDLATPNSLELTSMHTTARDVGLYDRQDWWRTIDALGIPASGARSELVAASSQALVDEGLPQRAIQLLPFIPTMITKMGARGVLLTRLLMEGDAALDTKWDRHVVARSRTGEFGVGGLYVRVFEPEEVLNGEDVINVNGAGDTFLGVVVAKLAAANGLRVEEVIPEAIRASVLTLRSMESVSPDIGSCN